MRVADLLLLLLCLEASHSLVRNGWTSVTTPAVHRSRNILNLQQPRVTGGCLNHLHVRLRLNGGGADSQTESETESEPRTTRPAATKAVVSAAQSVGPVDRLSAEKNTDIAKTRADDARGNVAESTERAANASVAANSTGNTTQANSSAPPPLTPEQLQALNQRLWEAAADGNEPLVDKVLKAGANVNAFCRGPDM